MLVLLMFAVCWSSKCSFFLLEAQPSTTDILERSGSFLVVVLGFLTTHGNTEMLEKGSVHCKDVWRKKACEIFIGLDFLGEKKAFLLFACRQRPLRFRTERDLISRNLIIISRLVLIVPKRFT